MKIVLISLPNPQLIEPAMNPPLGLCYISSYLKSKGFYDITLIDYSLENDFDFYNGREYLKLIPLDADIYGISVMTPQYRWLIDVTKHIKSHNRKVMVVSGGAHSSNIPEDCLSVGVDVAVAGDGEIPFTMLCEGYNPSVVPGAVMPGGNGNHKIMIALDELPWPDRDLTDLLRYKRLLMHEADRGEIGGDDKAVHIVTMRGCPYNCAFCDRFSVGRQVRYRSVENVMKEVDWINHKYGLNAFVIYDDTFTLSRKRVLQFCEEFVKRGSKWRTWARVNTIDKETVQTMKDSGCMKLLFGFESGDDRILKIINKKTTRKQNIEAAHICRDVGIGCAITLIYGLPGETKESIDNTISMIEEAQPPNEVYFHVLAPMPGSPIWDNPGAYGIEIDKQKLREQYYAPTSLTDSPSGLGHIYYKHDQMDEVEFRDNLIYFVRELRKVTNNLIQRIEGDKV